MKATFYISNRPESRTVKIYLRYVDDSGQVYNATPSTAEMAHEPGIEIEPVFKFRDDEASSALQSMMDELWNNGIRPSDIGTPGHLAATKAHLADFRAIAANLLKVDLPKI